jgi:hypothetical protein
MDWIFDNIQIFLIAIAVVGSLLKKFFEAKAEERQAREEVAPPTGQRKPPAAPSVPPPLTRSAATPTFSSPSTSPKTREIGYEAAVASEAAKALKHQMDLAERLRQIREAKAVTSGGASATRARVAAKNTPKAVALIPILLRERLRNPAEIRNALIMREILDPPIALR